MGYTAHHLSHGHDAPLLYRKGRETPTKGALPSLSTKVAFSTYSYPRSSAYKEEGSHVDTER